MYSGFIFFVAVCFIILFGIFNSISLMRLSSFASSYSALQSEVTRYYTLYNVAKMEHDEKGMSGAFAKLESSFAAYQGMCQKRDSLLSLTNLNRAQIPNLFVKIDRDTEAMETVFTVCRLMA